MTHAPFIPLREAKYREVGCQGEFKGNFECRVHREVKEQREEEVNTDGYTFRGLRFVPGFVEKTRGSVKLSATDVSPISFKLEPQFGVAAL